MFLCVFQHFNSYMQPRGIYKYSKVLSNYNFNNINYLKYVSSNMCLLLYIIHNRSEEIIESDKLFMNKTKNEKLLTQNSVSLSG